MVGKMSTLAKYFNIQPRATSISTDDEGPTAAVSKEAAEIDTNAASTDDVTPAEISTNTSTDNASSLETSTDKTAPTGTSTYQSPPTKTSTDNAVATEISTDNAAPTESSTESIGYEDFLKQLRGCQSSSADSLPAADDAVADSGSLTSAESSALCDAKASEEEEVNPTDTRESLQESPDVKEYPSSVRLEKPASKPSSTLAKYFTIRGPSSKVQHADKAQPVEKQQTPMQSAKMVLASEKVQATPKELPLPTVQAVEKGQSTENEQALGKVPDDQTSQCDDKTKAKKTRLVKKARSAAKVPSAGKVRRAEKEQPVEGMDKEDESQDTETVQHTNDTEPGSNIDECCERDVRLDEPSAVDISKSKRKLKKGELVTQQNEVKLVTQQNEVKLVTQQNEVKLVTQQNETATNGTKQKARSTTSRSRRKTDTKRRDKTLIDPTEGLSPLDEPRRDGAVPADVLMLVSECGSPHLNLGVDDSRPVSRRSTSVDNTRSTTVTPSSSRVDSTRLSLSEVRRRVKEQKASRSDKESEEVRTPSRRKWKFSELSLVNPCGEIKICKSPTVEESNKGSQNRSKQKSKSKKTAHNTEETTEQKTEQLGTRKQKKSKRKTDLEDVHTAFDGGDVYTALDGAEKVMRNKSKRAQPLPDADCESESLSAESAAKEVRIEGAGTVGSAPTKKRRKKASRRKESVVEDDTHLTDQKSVVPVSSGSAVELVCSAAQTTQDADATDEATCLTDIRQSLQENAVAADDIVAAGVKESSAPVKLEKPASKPSSTLAKYFTIRGPSSKVQHVDKVQPVENQQSPVQSAEQKLSAKKLKLVKKVQPVEEAPSIDKDRSLVKVQSAEKEQALEKVLNDERAQYEDKVKVAKKSRPAKKAKGAAKVLPAEKLRAMNNVDESQDTEPVHHAKDTESGSNKAEGGERDIQLDEPPVGTISRSKRKLKKRELISPQNETTSHEPKQKARNKTSRSRRKTDAKRHDKTLIDPTGESSPLVEPRRDGEVPADVLTLVSECGSPHLDLGVDSSRPVSRQFTPVSNAQSTTATPSGSLLDSTRLSLSEVRRRLRDKVTSRSDKECGEIRTPSRPKRKVREISLVNQSSEEIIVMAPVKEDSRKASRNCDKHRSKAKVNSQKTEEAVGEKTSKSATRKRSKLKENTELVDVDEAFDGADRKRKRSRRTRPVSGGDCESERLSAETTAKEVASEEGAEGPSKKRHKKKKKSRKNTDPSDKPVVPSQPSSPLPSVPVVELLCSSADDEEMTNASGSQSSPAAPKRRQKKSTPTSRKRRKLLLNQQKAEDDDNGDIIMMAEVSSPSTTLREERLARLHAMSTPSDYANLKQTKATKPLTQAEFFPRIGHITQLPPTEDEGECRLQFIPTQAHTDIEGVHQTIGLDIQRAKPVPLSQHKKEKLTNSKVKRELNKLQTLLPQYPVHDVYDILDSRVSSDGDTSDQLWTGKYSPSTFSQLLVRKGYVEIINEWLLNWKRDIVTGQASANRKQNKKKSSKKRNQFIDDSESEQSEDELTQTPVLVVSGGGGLGKTTSAYTIAGLLGYKVFEINPSMLRTTRTIMEKVHESTRSQQVRKGKGVSIDQMFDRIHQETSKPAFNGGIASFFTKLKKKQDTAKADKPEDKSQIDKGEETEASTKRKSKDKKGEDDETASETETDGVESVGLSKLSLILFDEADIAFEEDKGFYETIRTLGLEAKKPIIITCQSTGFLRNLGVEYTHVEITPHLHTEVAAYMCLVSLVEGEVADFDAMTELVSKYNCDIRRCILQVQYLVSSGGLKNLNLRLNKHPAKHKKKAKALTSPVHTLAKISRHQSTLDLIATHQRLSSPGNGCPVSKISSNCSRVFVDTTASTLLADDPVTWSSIRQAKSVYTELLRDTFSLPDSKTSLSSAAIPPAELMLAIREELPPYTSDTSDWVLSLDFLPFMAAVCAAENERRASKASRRFLHHLAKAGLYMTEDHQLAVTKILQSAESNAANSAAADD